MLGYDTVLYYCLYEGFCFFETFFMPIKIGKADQHRGRVWLDLGLYVSCVYE